MKLSVVVIGIVILIIIASMWASALSNINIGHPMFGGVSAEAAAIQKSSVNTSYGLFFFIVLLATPTLAYLLKKKSTT